MDCLFNFPHICEHYLVIFVLYFMQYAAIFLSHYSPSDFSSSSQNFKCIVHWKFIHFPTCWSWGCPNTCSGPCKIQRKYVSLKFHTIFWNLILVSVKNQQHSLRLHYEQHTESGWTLEQHWSSETTLELIRKGDWDVVVLQVRFIWPIIWNWNIYISIFSDRLKVFVIQVNLCQKF